MTFCLMSHRVFLNPPIILLMDPGGIPSDGIKGSPGEGSGVQGRKRPSALFLPAPHAWSPSFRSIGHALPPSLVLHTPNKHASTYSSKKLKLRVSSRRPGPVDTSGPSLLALRVKIMLLNLKRFSLQQVSAV